jgi:hypothetical protein
VQPIEVEVAAPGRHAGRHLAATTVLVLRAAQSARADEPAPGSAAQQQLREANALLLVDIDRDIPNTRMVSSPRSVRWAMAH